MARRSAEERVDTLGGPTTVGELRERCSVLEPGIIFVREAPHSTAEVFNIFVEEVHELGAPFGSFAVINDLTEAKTRPRREHLDAIVSALKNVGVHWAIVQPGSAFLRTVARFVLARVARSGGRTSVHEHLDSALVAARTALRSS